MKPRHALGRKSRISSVFRPISRTVQNTAGTLARGHVNLGILQRSRGDVTDAGSSYRCAIELNEELAKTDPSVLQYRLDLAMCSHNLGEILLAQGRLEEACATASQSPEAPGSACRRAS